MRHRPDPASTACPRMEGLPPEALSHVAAYFQALSEPTRLQVLNLLRAGERKVGEVAQACGSSAANISRHLSLLMQHGLVARESRGTAVYYRIADDSVYALCELVCGSIAQRRKRGADQRKAFAGILQASTRRTSSGPDAVEPSQYDVHRDSPNGSDLAI